MIIELCRRISRSDAWRGMLAALVAAGGLACACVPGQVQAGAVLDPAWAPRIEIVGTVALIAVQPDNQAIIAGDFSAVNGVPRNRLARLKADGSLDLAFNLKAPDVFNNYIYAVAIQPDGKIIVGGDLFYFISYEAGVMDVRQYAARLDSSGTLDPSFHVGSYVDGGVDGTVRALAADAQGRILAGGDFTRISGASRPHLARLLSNGSVDPTFDTGLGPNGAVTAIAFQPDGRILIGGDFTHYNGVSCPRYARLAANGALDPEFSVGAGADGTVKSIAVESDGRIAMAGAFSVVRGQERRGIARLSAAGDLDAGLNQYYLYGVNTVAAFPGNRLVVGGWEPGIIFGGQPTDHDATLIGFGADGAALSVLYFEGDFTEVLALARRPDGRLLCAGNFRSIESRASGEPPIYRHGLCLLQNEYLSLVDGFTPVAANPGTVLSMAREPDDAMTLVGEFTLVNGQPITNCVRVTAAGQADSAFQADIRPVSIPRAIRRLDDGRLLVGGNGGLVRLLGNGTPDPAFSRQITMQVNDLELLPDQKIIVAGDSWTSQKGLARLFSTGLLDTNFNIGAGLAGYPYEIRDIARQPDGKLICAGSFSSFNNLTITNVVRLSSEGGVDASFVPPAFATFNESWPAELRSVAVAADGGIFVGGYFSRVGGQSRPSLVRLGDDGQVDGSFVSPINDSGGTVKALCPSPDGGLLVGGDFQVFAPSGLLNSFIRIRTDRELDNDFQVDIARGIVTDGGVRTIAMEGDGLWIGGAFPAVNGEPRNSAARFHVTIPPARPTLSIARAGAGEVVLSWPVADGAATLEATPVLGSGADWQPVGAVPNIAGDRYQATLQVSPGARFFRLRQP